jgi:EAL domain-containing protein (putative c-di-GMP-specific phosphodiesterase class I)
LLEETGLILEVGWWALEKALSDYRRWHDAGMQVPPIAVNVSAVQLQQRNFASLVSRAIDSSSAGPKALELEITESLIMADIETNIETLRQISDMGVTIAIDDFGTGYSSLRYLAKLPVHSLKIDRSFIITMINDPNSMTIVSTVISLAHALALKVVAEGVDSEEQSKLLRLLKCDEMQGYRFSQPVPADKCVALIQNGGKFEVP